MYFSSATDGLSAAFGKTDALDIAVFNVSCEVGDDFLNGDGRVGTCGDEDNRAGFVGAEDRENAFDTFGERVRRVIRAESSGINTALDANYGRGSEMGVGGEEARDEGDVRGGVGGRTVEVGRVEVGVASFEGGFDGEEGGGIGSGSGGPGHIHEPETDGADGEGNFGEEDSSGD